MAPEAPLEHSTELEQFSIECCETKTNYMYMYLPFRLLNKSQIVVKLKPKPVIGMPDYFWHSIENHIIQ